MAMTAIRCLAFSHMPQKRFHFATVWGRLAVRAGACSAMMEYQKTLLFGFEIPITSAYATWRANTDGKAHGNITLANVWNGFGHGGTF
mmetsp:Transcript_8708/g.10105  ORF Transcript_8708/g.10105 Transcript_8708/m.10105 type:complete len:88 (+) Transcript_8708:358-621(+)|eukprot:CAMPEP_0204618652 /NCGR_PEP_ID=MMETSP0717-20131115/5229_1 /ASSEMBLY_ACC=CAM_ASM_000666 /TAXON_ID=230516 /ORGANISM="Chaetoceros curvisetus" /LENGTH=87 /DNA_ID=CAMNT_0051632435 /DNA_START=336 /DNA_END=599 /DNA_ORIENTATION=+